ncbi:hypothetical protein ACL02U_09735 [Streptomyces sp. MS06]|uniref:hypothetical protein n=1 Tax=Streptomyces sp. MS06 TaxID=3385974 RepID=UPI0039A35D34
MTPYERLLAEDAPSRPAPDRPRPWTDEDRDAHWNALCDVVGTPGAQRPTRPQEAA